MDTLALVPKVVNIRESNRQNNSRVYGFSPFWRFLQETIMTEEQGITELTQDQLDAVNGAGWLSDFFGAIADWAREHLFGRGEIDGNEEGIKKWEFELGGKIKF